MISKHALSAFWLKHPASRVRLEAWYRLIRATSYFSFMDLKQSFNSVDYVAPFVVFDIGGNNFRVISAIHFDRQKVYVREVLTHAEYDRWSKSYRSKKS